MLFIIVLVGVAVAVLLVLLLPPPKPSRPASPRVETTGTITALEPDYGRWHYCHPVVRFRNSRGEWLTLRCRTSILRENLRVGQQVPVRYATATPEGFIVVTGLDFLL